jgi:myo-inositol 2-dehydrogenase/D-chiro-inositol 1-dehydrogenase
MSTERKRARLVLVGTGRIGTVHMNNIFSLTRAVMVGVCEVLGDRKVEYANKIGCKGYATINEALEDDSNPFDGVLVCTPTQTHYEVVKTSLLGGKHVFCEKPISLNLQESDECYEIAKAKGLFLLCAFQRRYDPNFMKVKDVVSKGGVGTLQKVRTVSRDNPVPSIEYLKSSGGIYHDCLSHDIDLIRWVTGKEPVEVFSYATNFIDAIKNIDDFDNVDCILKFENGIIGNIDVSRKAVYGYDQTITCLGDKGMVTADNRQPTTVVHSTETGITRDPNCYSFPTRYPEAYTA